MSPFLHRDLIRMIFWGDGMGRLFGESVLEKPREIWMS